jgi:hypothetical protein
MIESVSPISGRLDIEFQVFYHIGLSHKFTERGRPKGLIGNQILFLRGRGCYVSVSHRGKGYLHRHFGVV